jgi:RNA polymerase-binding protein DksA
MNAKDMKHFEELLLARRKKLLEGLGFFEEKVFTESQRSSSGDLSSYSYHMADQASDAMELEQALQMFSSEGRLIYHIDRALERIRDKTYGECVKCGKEIARDRLEVVPHARMCIDCKRAEEEEKKKK